jgi:hypothetical protein
MHALKRHTQSDIAKTPASADSWAYGQAVGCPEVERQDEVIVTLSDRAESDKNLRKERRSQVCVWHICAYHIIPATHVIGISAKRSPQVPTVVER